MLNGWHPVVDHLHTVSMMDTVLKIIEFLALVFALACSGWVVYVALTFLIWGP